MREMVPTIELETWPAAVPLPPQIPVEVTARVGQVTDVCPPSIVACVQAQLDELQRLSRELDEMDHDPEPPSTLHLPADFLLSIIVPVYNERTTIRQIIGRLLALQAVPKEIIVIDDGSTDGTRDELVALRHLPGLRIILKPENEGKGAALRTGFAYAQGQIVMVQDADLEYDPRDIPNLLRPILDHEADVVYGSRFLQRRGRGSSSMHQWGNRLLTWASNLTTGLQLTDMETCYKVFHADVLSRLTIRQNRFGFEPEVTAKVARHGWRIAELPVRYHARDWQEGKKIGWSDALNALYCIFRYAWRD